VSDGELELSVVMPCLNEADTLETCIIKAKSAIAAHDVRGEVLIPTTVRPTAPRRSPNDWGRASSTSRPKVTATL